MKTKLTISVDKSLIPKAKQYATLSGRSLSSLIEEMLKHVTSQSTKTFSEKWRGTFVPAKKKDARYKQLAKRLL